MRAGENSSLAPHIIRCLHRHISLPPPGGGGSDPCPAIDGLAAFGILTISEQVPNRGLFDTYVLPEPKHDPSTFSARRQLTRNVSKYGRPFLAGLASLLTVVTAAGSARGEVHLDWFAPPECPTEAAMRERVERELDPSRDVGARAAIVFDLPRSVYVLRLDLEGGGQRVLENGDCDRLAEMASIVLAMSARERETPKKVPSEGDLQTPVVREKGRPIHLDLAGIAGIGLMPKVALGVGFAAGFAPTARLAFSVQGSYFAPRNAQASVDPSRSAEVRRLGVDVRGCAIFAPSLEGAACVGVDFASLSATGNGAAVTRDARASLIAPFVGLALTPARSGALAFRMGADFLFPLTRPSFVVIATGTVFRPEIASLRLWLGPSLRF